MFLIWKTNAAREFYARACPGLEPPVARVVCSHRVKKSLKHHAIMQAAILFCSLNKSLHWHSGADWYIALQNISRQLWLLLTKARSSSTACITCLGNLAALKLKLYSSNCAFSFYVIYLAISTPPQEQVMQWRMTIPRKKHLYQAEPGSEMTSWSNPQKSPYSLSPIHQLGEFKPGRGLGASGHVQHQRYENVGRSKTRPP